jgi:diguanylate cyclase (GGDEF)-like protein
MKKRFLLKSTIFIIVTLQVISLIFILNYMSNTENHVPASLLLFTGSSLLLLILFIISVNFYFHAYKKINRSLRLNHVIYSLLQQSIYTKSSSAFYQTILESALTCIDDASKGSIILMDTASNKLHFAASVGYDMDVLKETYLELEQTYLYRESNGHINKTVKIHNPFEYDRININVHNIRAILKAGTDNIMTTLSTPIYFNNKLYGMLNIDSPKTDAYDTYDIEIIELFAAEISNVLKLFRSIEENQFHMNYDLLTGLPNRKFINEYIDMIHQGAAINQVPYSLVSIDLNNLKKTNDEFGHPIGDQLLTSFSHLFLENIPKEAKIGRYGGDEFMLVLPSMDKHTADILMIAIVSTMNKNFIDVGQQSIGLSFCYGISTYGEDSTEISELIRESDRLMYEQKRLFHNQQTQSYYYSPTP